MKNVFKTITWIFSLILVVTLVSCEKQVDLKGASMIGDAPVVGDYPCGLYHSYWNVDVGSPNENKTTVFYIDTVGGIATFHAVNKTPFDKKFHIALDEAGLIYLLDEMTGDIYTWPRQDAVAPTMIMAGTDYHSIPPSRIQFTQAVVADYDHEKYLAVSSTKPGYEIVYLIDISGVPAPYDTIRVGDRGYDIEGADLAVSAGAFDYLYLFTKEAPYRLDIKLADKSITPNPANAGNEVTGTAELGGRMWVTKSNKSEIYSFAPDLSSSVAYPIAGDAPSKLVYGDLASCSPQWPQDVFYHSQWIGKSGATKIYAVIPDIPVKTAKFIEINPIAFEQRLHMAEDHNGYLWMIDENTGDIYKWAPNNTDVVLPAPEIMGSVFPPLAKKQFTQLVIAETAGGDMHLFVGEMKNDIVFRIDVATGTVVQAITHPEWDVSGGDLVVTPMEDKVLMFSKAEDPDGISDKKVWSIDLAGGLPTMVPSEAGAGEQINGSVYFGGTIFLSKGVNTLETWNIGDPGTDIYTLIGAPRLHYGDLAAKSPIWSSMTPAP